MIRLPAAISRRLTLLFASDEDRDRFVADALEAALDEYEQSAGAPVGDDLILTEEDLAPEPGVLDRSTPVGGTLHLFSDGGSRGNPGQAAIAAILEDPVRGEVLDQHAERIGVETNNVAEYRALIAGLKMAVRFRPSRLVCHLDSELVVRQVNGQYQVKMETLKPYVEEIRALSKQLPDVVFIHIPRADNHRADALVNKVLDEGRRLAGSAPRPLPQRRGY